MLVEYEQIFKPKRIPMLKNLNYIVAILAVASSSVCCSHINDAPLEVTEAYGVVATIGSMNAARAAHTATLLPNGKVLIAGGFDGAENGKTSAELYDPATKTFAAAGKMMTPRQSHTATLLPNGKVLIAGGYNGTYLASAEIYDPVTGNFTPTGQMSMARHGHVAILLENGKVLVAGGVGEGYTFLAGAELYDPATGAFAPTGNMTAARESHTITMLPGGSVLITGGHRGRRSDITIYANAEIYDPATGAFRPTGNMTIRRHKHDAAPLPNGQVLITGGSDERDGVFASAEIYNPTTGAFRAIGNMPIVRYKHVGTSILLPSGKVLVAGGANNAVIYDPANGIFSVVAGSLGTNRLSRLFSTATLLSTGEVLITGGYSPGQNISAGVWVYKP